MLTHAAIARHRMRQQRLTGPRFASPEAMVGWHGAVQAQEYAHAAWGIAQRCDGDRDGEGAVTACVTAGDIDLALDEGRLLRTHVLRPTWHLVCPEDIRWLLALTGPRVLQTMQAAKRDFELDADLLARAHLLIAAALRDGALTRRELTPVLASGGIEATGSRLAHIMGDAELTGLVCSGPRRNRQHTYMLLDDRAPAGPAWSREEALAELTRRYLASHGPATPHDLAWWSGLTVRDARVGIASLGDVVESETIDGVTWYWLGDLIDQAACAPTVHLLPPFDEHFVGFRNREPVIAAEVWQRWGRSVDQRLRFPIAVDGVVVGEWARVIGADAVTITTPFPVALDADRRALLASAAEGYGRFLGLPTVLDEKSTRHS